MQLLPTHFTAFSNKLVFLLSLMLASTAFGQRVSDEQKYTVSISLPYWIQHPDYAFSPVRYSGSMYGYSAIPTYEFTENSTIGILESGRFSIAAGRIFKFGNVSNHTQIGAAQIVVNGINGERLRFTDQLKSDRGFVKPSSFDIGEFRSFNRFIFFRSHLLFRADLLGRKQFLGMGIFAYAVLQSGYNLQLDHPNGRRYFYETTHLRSRDKIAQLTPEITHQIELYHNSRKALYWHNTIGWPALHFEQVAHRKLFGEYYANSRWIRPILESGLTLYLTGKR